MFATDNEMRSIGARVDALKMILLVWELGSQVDLARLFYLILSNVDDSSYSWPATFSTRYDAVAALGVQVSTYILAPTYRVPPLAQSQSGFVMSPPVGPAVVPMSPMPPPGFGPGAPVVQPLVPPEGVESAMDGFIPPRP